MSPAMLFVLSALATFYAWWVLARSKLPMLWRLREMAYNRWPPDPPRATLLATWDGQLGGIQLHARPGPPMHREQPRPRVSQIAKMWDCPWCLGWWLAGVVTLGCDLVGDVPMPALWWPALTAAVVGVARVLDR